MKKDITAGEGCRGGVGCVAANAAANLSVRDCM
jgi:hypothetical protein